ncbi:MAG: CRISPR-associated protein Csx3 [Anaerolineales bacterium]
MNGIRPEPLAPCVAVVGPASSGKTTLLHLLDDALQRHAVQPLAYIVKGNPDGTGRYLFHAPELRETLKERVKGAWCESTVETVCGWIEHCRRHLDLVLVDLGGRHAPGNAAIFQRCTHYLVLARRFEEPARERGEGMGSWIEACRRSGLGPLAELRSLVGEGTPALARSGDALTGAFRADAAGPGDRTNDAVIDGLVEALLALRSKHRRPLYLDLRLGRDWRPEDLGHLGGLAPRLIDRVRSGETLVLGGRAPIWAYCAALHRVLDADSDAVVEVFDPKLPSGLVEIPRTLTGVADPNLERSLEVAWRSSDRAAVGALALRIVTPDRFLRLPRPGDLAAVPLPAGEPPPGPLVVSGAAPIWLHLTYSRWLRRLTQERAIGVWDARMKSAVFVSGPGSPCVVSCEEPGG